MKSADLTGAVWRKSSRSNGQAECVEVGDQRTMIRRDSISSTAPPRYVGRWRRSGPPAWRARTGGLTRRR